MTIDYSDIGLGTNLLKGVEGAIQMIDPDTQIEDGSIRGIKVQSRSLPLDKLYGTDLTIGGDNNISGKLIATDVSGVPRIIVDATTGINVNTGANSTPVFQALIKDTGTLSAGDVQIGTWDGISGAGALYDNPGAFSFSGDLNAGSITIGSNFHVDNAGNMTASNAILSGTIHAAAGDIGGWSITSTTLTKNNAILDSAGKITVSDGNDKVMLDVSSGVGYLRFFAGGSVRASLRGVTATGATGVVSDGDVVVVNNKSFLMTSTSTSDYGRIGVSSDNGMLITLTNPAVGGASPGHLRIVNFDNTVDYFHINANTGMYFDDHGGDFNFSNGNLNVNNKDLQNVQHIYNHSGDDLYLDASAGSRHVTLNSNINMGGHNIDGGASIYLNGHELKASTTYQKINYDGLDKTAIVPTLKGYQALYSIESPEVWFVDFAKVEHKWWQFWKKPNYIVDKTFLEVTVPPYIPMPTLVKGWVQVWGKRKGHENKRFEEKTEAEFKKNEEFLAMAKIDKAVDKG